MSIQSNKSCMRNILKTIVRYRWLEIYYRWNGMHTITDRFLHNHWFARCSHWPDMSQCTKKKHKSWVAGRKNNFSSKNVDVNELNLEIQHLLPEGLVSYKSIDTVCDATEAVIYPIEL
jgi:hypothetical protein